MQKEKNCFTRDKWLDSMKGAAGKAMQVTGRWSFKLRVE
jgi:hypothetical protein